MTLDDIDWRARILRVNQTKTKQALQLPLTDEAANVLIAYLRKVRPQSEHRHLFLKVNAPVGPLHPFSVNNVLRHRIRLSGLKFEASGSHMLRHYADLRTMPIAKLPGATSIAPAWANWHLAASFIRPSPDRFRGS